MTKDVGSWRVGPIEEWKWARWKQAGMWLEMDSVPGPFANPACPHIFSSFWCIAFHWGLTRPHNRDPTRQENQRGPCPDDTGAPSLPEGQQQPEMVKELL